MKYGEDNVVLYTIESVRSFLMFNRIGNGMESEHLKARKNEDKEAIIAKIKAMRAEGATLVEIAEALGMTKSTVDRWSKL
jgi:DNA invertase Pin-like site-specific DNA recombinase